MAFLVVRAVPAGDPRNPWFSWEYIRQNSDSIKSALVQHVELTVLAIAIAAAIAIPLAILASRVRWLAGPILSLSGVLYTIPSLALFALLGPLLGLTVQTALVGLVMYALLAIVRNALTGLRQVPADVRDAARGMGYSPAQLLWRIDLPLALPGIMTGLRIATVSTVALVTVTSIVSYGGFGMEILTGFNRNLYRPQIMFATLACVVLALTFDLLLVLLGKALMPWSRRRRAAS